MPPKKDTRTEKRLYPRRTFRTRVIFEDEWGEGFVYFYSTDISLGGIFFESDLPLKLGTKVFLSFFVESSRVKATGEIVRIAREGGSLQLISGMGVQFLGLESKAKEILESYLRPSPGLRNRRHS